MTGRQMEGLRDAFCSAFDQESLDQMLRLRLDKVRIHLAGAGALRDVAFHVIEVAVREGWHADLIRAAISYSPGNMALRRFCEEHPELMGMRMDSATTAASGPEEKKRGAQSSSFTKGRRKVYSELWERVERLNVEGRVEEMRSDEFSRRLAEINAFLLTSNVYIDDADRKLVNSYVRAARAFQEAVRSSGDVGASIALGETEDIPEEVIQRFNGIADSQSEALTLRATLLKKVRAIVSGQDGQV